MGGFSDVSSVLYTRGVPLSVLRTSRYFPKFLNAWADIDLGRFISREYRIILSNASRISKEADGDTVKNTISSIGVVYALRAIPG